METQYNKNTNQPVEKERNPFGGGRAIAGLIVVIVGTLLLAREVGADIPYWFFSWHMLLIAFGLISRRTSFLPESGVVDTGSDRFRLSFRGPRARNQSKRILLADAYHRRWGGNDIKISPKSKWRHI